jgi:hypothetical protein
VKARIHYGRIEGSLVFERSAFWKEPVYVSHAGQTQELTQGENWFSFAWSPTEDVYCGPKRDGTKAGLSMFREMLDNRKEGRP